MFLNEVLTNARKATGYKAIKPIPMENSKKELRIKKD